ncbi:uncharacterized protein [Montipora foliosa]|uniref:uncharacterized protein isoform X1 n=1 Tax=Montipora foliosa TaxID=591990 RepID=UPI0035F1A7E8
MEFILFYAMIVTVSLGYPAVSPEVLSQTPYELSSYKRTQCQTNANTLIQIQCDSNSENNTCNATCDGNGVDTTVTRLTLFSGNSENGERQVCIESFNGHILNVSDSGRVILQVSKDSRFPSSDRVNERTNRERLQKLFGTVPFEPDHDMRTHLSEHESESYSLIRKLLRKEECLKEGVDREGVEPLVNPPQGRSCNDNGMVFPFLWSAVRINEDDLFFFIHKSTKMMLVCSCESNSLTLKKINTKQLATNPTPLFIPIRLT